MHGLFGHFRQRINNFLYKSCGRQPWKPFNYFKTYFVDIEHGGFFWKIAADGTPVDCKKHIYTQAFGIYGLVEYFLAFGDTEAFFIAKKMHQCIEETARDLENGGYFEAYQQNWTPIEDVRLSEKDKNTPKSMNTHLHVLEAYTNLYRVEPSNELKSSLVDLIQLFCDRIINSERTSLINFMDKDWTPMSDLVSFGHDIEASWLLVEAAEVLQDETLLRKTQEIAIHMADAVLQNGIDPDGGLINEADAQGICDSDKDWWPQAEAVIGFLNAYEISGQPKFLQASVNSWNFIKTHMIDHTYGEWFEKTNRQGNPYHKMDKVRLWKGPYHNMRAVLEVIRRANKLIGKDDEQMAKIFS